MATSLLLAAPVVHAQPVAPQAVPPPTAPPIPTTPALTAPVVISHVDAVYPENAEHKHADVVLRVTIDKDGKVDSVDVLQSGGKELDEAAVVAMRQWVFKPATRDGVADPESHQSPVPLQPADAAARRLALRGDWRSDQQRSEGRRDDRAVGRVLDRGADAGPDARAGQRRDGGRGARPRRIAALRDFEIQVGDLASASRVQTRPPCSPWRPGSCCPTRAARVTPSKCSCVASTRAKGRDIEFTAGGVPVNESGNLHGNGYADTHFVIPELVTNLRVLEGPFDPIKGTTR